MEEEGSQRHRRTPTGGGERKNTRLDKELREGQEVPVKGLVFFICLFSRATGTFYCSHEELKKKGSVQYGRMRVSSCWVVSPSVAEKGFSSG